MKGIGDDAFDFGYSSEFMVLNIVIVSTWILSACQMPGISLGSCSVSCSSNLYCFPYQPVSVSISKFVQLYILISNKNAFVHTRKFTKHPTEDEML